MAPRLTVSLLLALATGTQPCWAAAPAAGSAALLAAETILDRRGARVQYGSFIGGIGDEGLAELQAVPNYDLHLMALARGPNRLQRPAAIQAAVELKVPGISTVLQEILDEPLPRQPAAARSAPGAAPDAGAPGQGREIVALGEPQWHTTGGGHREDLRLRLLAGTWRVTQAGVSLIWIE